MEKAFEKNIEEILEALWTDEEQQRETDMGSLRSPHQTLPLLDAGEMKEALKMARERGLVEVAGRVLSLTGTGRERALDLVRRHRLAERLFYDVLDVGHDESESSACQLEHLLSPEAANSVCILLGHPTTCPHGNPIPRGSCCQQHLSDARPLVIPASELRPGETATVAYIGGRSKERIDRISSLGITPGIAVRLLQRHPSFVLRLGETQLALDKEIMQDIYVRRSSAGPEKPKKWRWGGTV
ncbi:MAG: metal-dependent transcriptional regulator [Chloroflexi bacterium]|nr:metal-dependent transcriptional regulator [Chloroflexota bacterium]